MSRWTYAAHRASTSREVREQRKGSALAKEAKCLSKISSAQAKEAEYASEGSRVRERRKQSTRAKEAECASKGSRVHEQRKQGARAKEA